MAVVSTDIFTIKFDTSSLQDYYATISGHWDTPSGYTIIATDWLHRADEAASESLQSTERVQRSERHIRMIRL
jgi:hypothetical protein